MLKFWRSWLYQLDPFTPTLAAMISTELVSVKLYLSWSEKTDYLAAVYKSDARRTNSQFSILQPEQRAFHGPKIL